MPRLDIVVPVKNEAGNVTLLVKRTDFALKKAGIRYRLYFVDDRSTDSTKVKLNLLKKKYPITVLTKKGLPGKAYSILEASKVVRSKYIAMIDGDLQYPPEALPAMFSLIKKHGVVVANRIKNKTPILRRAGSLVNVLVFERILNGFTVDTQSGLKVFRKEIIDQIGEKDVSKWTIDMPLLRTARDLGFTIGSVDIVFSERKNGQSKINFLKAALEIAISSLRLRFSGPRIYYNNPKSGKANGLIFKGKEFKTYTHLAFKESALVTLYPWQKVLLAFLVVTFLLGLLIDPKLTGIVLVMILSLLYFLDLLFSTSLLLKSLHVSPEIDITDNEIAKLNKRTLPLYTILCPLYREGQILGHFIKGLSALNWPKNRLQVLLLIEEDDEETRKALKKIKLPKFIKALIVPDSQPKTKPKACNFGLACARGEFIVVYDAEDLPEPNQLKKAYLTFKKLDSKVICLQSKLNYYNPDNNILTRLFSIEYSLWFDLILPGLQSVEAPIPLGGTSNHFKTAILKKIQGWDPFNVTEDCDLGVRLFKEGYKTAIINSLTLEEALTSPKRWIRQRSRWIKGYLQTYFVHTRDPLELVKKQGLKSLFFHLVIGARMMFIFVNPILWAATFLYFALYSFVGPVIEEIYPTLIFYIASVSLVFGNFIYFYNYMIAAAIRKQWEFIKYVFLVPFYWAITSIAAVLAGYQLFANPHFWEKTHHGFHLARKPKRRWVIRTALVPRISLSSLFKRVTQPIGIIARNLTDFIGLFVPVDPYALKPNSSGSRILIFNWRDTKHVWAGGAEVYIHELAKRWVREGHTITLFCGHDGKYKRNGNVEGVQIIRRGGFYTVYLFAFLYYILKFRNKFDFVIDCENAIPFFTPLYINVPKILLIHHVHQEVFRRHLNRLTSSIAVFLEGKAMPFIYKNVPVIAISNSTKKDIVDLGWAKDEAIDIVTPGVDLNAFRRTKKTKYPSFLYLGRLKSYKNIDVAIKAFALLKKKYQRSQFTIAGIGEEKERLGRLVTRMDLHDSIKFAGRVTETRKVTLLGRSWAVLQPSSFEGWGITVIEANACSTPVIASNVKGLRDSVFNNKSGILVKPKEAEDMAKAMIKIVANRNFRSKLVKGGRSWSRNFVWEKSARKFMQIIMYSLQRHEAIAGKELVAGEV